jgi:hypothetical protein
MERELIIHIPIEGPESIVEIKDDEARTVLVEPDHLQCLVLHLLVVFHEKVFAGSQHYSVKATMGGPSSIKMVQASALTEACLIVNSNAFLLGSDLSLVAFLFDFYFLIFLSNCTGKLAVDRVFFFKKII